MYKIIITLLLITISSEANYCYLNSKIILGKTTHYDMRIHEYCVKGTLWYRFENSKNLTQVFKTLSYSTVTVLCTCNTGNK